MKFPLRIQELRKSWSSPPPGRQNNIRRLSQTPSNVIYKSPSPSNRAVDRRDGQWISRRQHEPEDSNRQSHRTMSFSQSQNTTKETIKARGATPAFRWEFNFPHVPWRPTKDILANPKHPLHCIFRKRFEDADYSGLWVAVYSNVLLSKNKVIRGHYERQIKRAVYAALKSHGFKYNGKSLHDGGGTRPIQGSLYLHPAPGTLAISFEEQISLAKQMVRKILTTRGQHTSNPMLTRL
jgi:hypothetical protein